MYHIHYYYIVFHYIVYFVYVYSNNFLILLSIIIYPIHPNSMSISLLSAQLYLLYLSYLMPYLTTLLYLIMIIYLL